jgi:hypothetical protein
MTRRGLVVILIVLVTLLSMWAWSRLKHWLLVDTCLDHGGRFDHVTQRCER